MLIQLSSIYWEFWLDYGFLAISYTKSTALQSLEQVSKASGSKKNTLFYYKSIFIFTDWFSFFINSLSVYSFFSHSNQQSLLPVLVAQLDRAPNFGFGGWEFESFQAYCSEKKQITTFRVKRFKKELFVLSQSNISFQNHWKNYAVLLSFLFEQICLPSVYFYRAHS